MNLRWTASVVALLLLATACGGSGPDVESTPRRPTAEVTWQIQYEGEIDPETEVGLFDLDLVETPETVMTRLSERRVYLLCYFSAGSLEDWRPDAGQFPAEVVGEPLDGWPGERWLDIRRLDVLGPLMEARMDLAVERGCDGVDPDNVNGFEASSGFDLSAADQIRYNTWLADAAHRRGLAIALKNDLNQVAELEPRFDMAVNEECIQIGECELEAPFVEAGKVVLGVEYVGDEQQICAESAVFGHRTLIKHLELDSWVISC